MKARALVSSLPIFVVLLVGAAADASSSKDDDGKGDISVGSAGSSDLVGPLELWSSTFGFQAGGWRVDRHPRFLADVNGDGKKDVVGFGGNGAIVALSSGTTFGSASVWVGAFGYANAAGAWRVDQHPRTVGDVNGDGMADAVGFGANGTFVSISSGTSFGAPTLWVNNYGASTAAGGWVVSQHPRLLADVNGDGKQDVVGFGNAGTYVSLSQGTSFKQPELWVNNYGYDDAAGGWRVDQHPRFLADVNNDGKDDVVGFGNAGTYVSLSTGTSFAAPVLWTANFGTAAGWQVSQHPRFLSDVDGDGKPDIVGMGNDGTYVSLSTGSAFTAPTLWVNNYGVNNGWAFDRDPRALADVNGDGRDDVVGFGEAGTYISLSTGTGFSTPVLWIANYGYSQGWRVDQHPRLLGDVDGDGSPDIVGFGNGGAYVSH